MKKPSKKSSHTIAYSIFVVAWAILALVIGQLLIAFPMAWLLDDQADQPFWVFIYYLLSYGLSLVLILLIPPRIPSLIARLRTKKSAKTPELIAPAELAATSQDLGLHQPPTFTDIALAPVGYLVYLFGAAILTSLMNLLPWFDASEAQDVGFNRFLGPSDRIFAMLAVVFLAPICEELIMRGWLYGKLRSRLRLIPAILITSVVFGLLHGQWNVGVSVFILSLVLCGLREITGTIWSGILLHIFVNGIAFYLLYVIGM